MLNVITLITYQATVQVVNQYMVEHSKVEIYSLARRFVKLVFVM